MTTPDQRVSMAERLRTDYDWTRRQRQVLDLLAAGRSNPEIADHLGISRDGAKYHISEVLSKLGVDSRDEAAEYWRRHQGLRPRFARVFQSIAGAAGLKWAAGVTVAAGITFVAAAVVLNRGDDEDPSPNPTTTSEAVTPGIAGTDSTGDPKLDEVIAAVLSGDRALMESFVRLEDVPCGLDFDSGNRMSCGNQPQRTPIPAFAHVGCDEVYWTPNGQFPWIDSLQGREPRLYAVYRQDAQASQPPDIPPKGSMVAVFETGVNGGFALDISDGEILAERGTCGPFPYWLTEDVPPGDFVLVPASGIPVPTPTPQPRLTGDAATDGLIRALVDGDIATIASSFTLFPEPCAAHPQGVGSPPKCPPGVPDGAEVQMARVMSCERAYLANAEDFRQLLQPLYRYPHWLYAVYRTDGTREFAFVPEGDFAIVVAVGLINNEGASTWFVEDGRLVGALLGCGGNAAAAVAGLSPSQFVIPPTP